MDDRDGPKVGLQFVCGNLDDLLLGDDQFPVCFGKAPYWLGLDPEFQWMIFSVSKKSSLNCCKYYCILGK